MQVFDLTKMIVTSKGVPTSIHSKSIEDFPDLFLDIALSLRQMGYDRHADTMENIAQCFEDELEFLDNMPRIVGAKWDTSAK